MKLSDRTNWPAGENRLATILAARRTSGRRILDLTETNPTSCGIPYPDLEILAAFRKEENLLYEPDPRGMLSAREAVADYYAERRVNANPDRIVLTSGTSESYMHLFKILCNPGEEVAVPRPSYPLFDYLAQLADVRLRHYAIVYDGSWHIDIPSLERAITPSTRAIVLVTPHNPTGMTIRDLRPIVHRAAMGGAAIIIDEVFADYVFGGRPAELLLGRCEAPLLVLNGISKLAGLPQMKLGWIVAGCGCTGELLDRLETVADTFLSVNTPVQHALPALFRVGKQIRVKISERITSNLAYARSVVTPATGCSILSCDGGWQAILRVPRLMSDEERAVELLDRNGVHVYPGYFFDFEGEGHLVLSLLPRPEIFRSGLEAILRPA